MLVKVSWQEARDLLLEHTSVTGREVLPLADACGRILSSQIKAVLNVPPFDRSPFDGYAFRSADTQGELPVTLKITEEVPAGSVSSQAVSSGTAVKILTGAPIPDGADCVVKFEETEYDADHVTIFRAMKHGEDVARAGEDVKIGDVLGERGRRLDAGVAGAVAAQGITDAEVYRIPKIGVVSIGSELVEPGAECGMGQIYNSSRYSLQAALLAEGLSPVFYPIPRDDTDDICAVVDQALKENDAVITTGGVSVGDYDLTRAAFEKAGARILCGDLRLKPGGKSWYAVRDGKLLYGLSGNPASAMTSFYAVALPSLRKMRGDIDGRLPEMEVPLAEDFRKKGKVTRLLRGRLILADGRISFAAADKQGNSALHTLAGANALAEIPAGAGPKEAGAVLKIYYLGNG